MRHRKGYPEETRRSIAQETIDIWAPLANRLGISSIKDELEDLSLKYINREVFDHIKSIVASKKGERAGYLEQAEAEIRKAASSAGIRISVKSRAKQSGLSPALCNPPPGKVHAQFHTRRVRNNFV